MDIDIDLEDFRLPDPGKLIETETHRRRRQKDAAWFIGGPIPGPWIGCAARLPGQALHVALAIQHASAVERLIRIRFTPKWRDLFGLSRNATYAGLDRLERAGLILVERSIGASPIVTILEWPSPEK